MIASASSMLLLFMLALACAKCVPVHMRGRNSLTTTSPREPSERSFPSIEQQSFSVLLPTELGRIRWRSHRTPGVLFLTYADGPFQDYLPSFRKQVELLGGRLLVFGDTNVSDLNVVGPCANGPADWDKSETPCVPPGYENSHCFQWKPRIVQQALGQMREDEDILLYLDSRSMFVGDMARVVDETRSQGSLLITSTAYPAVKHVKRAVWEYLGVEPDSNPHFPYRMSGSVLGLSKHSSISKAIVDKWVEVSDQPKLLCNGGTPDTPESDGFVTHEHDQATLTAVCVSLKDEREQCHWVDRDEWLWFSNVELLQKLGITCGSKSLRGSPEQRLKPCASQSGPMADQPASEEVVQMLSKYVIGKKLRPPLREALIAQTTSS